MDGVWAMLLDELRRGCDQAEGVDWTVAVDGTVVRAHQHAAGARRTPPAHLPIRTAFDLASNALDPELADRPLSDDIAHAADVLDALADV
jgi:hypothetical protein